MSVPVKPNSLAGKNVIVTGEIDGLTRTAAQEILENAGAKYEKSLNKKVNLVVLGRDAGAKKLEKIAEMGTETKQWDDLIAEIQAEGDDKEGPARNGEDGDEMEEDAPAEKPKKKAPATKASSSKVAAPSGSGPGSSSLEGKIVIITGTIPGHDRKSAASVLENAGAKIAKSLNKSVELVVLGTNAGPDKMTKIEEMGVTTAKWADVARELGLPGIEAEDDDKDESPPVNSVEAPTDISGMTVLITGTVQGHTRSSAQKLLEGAGAKSAKSLNKQVELVVLGTKPGPDKMKTIADLGVDTVKWEELVQALGLPEGGEPPKKKAKK